MAMQAHEPFSKNLQHIEESLATEVAPNDLGCVAHCEELVMQDEAIKQSSVHDARNASTSSADELTSWLSDGQGGSELFMQPALKRIRCRVRQIDHEPSLIKVALLIEESKSDDGKLHLRIGDEHTSSFAVNEAKVDDLGRITRNDQQNEAICKGESETADEEEEESECVTPTAREQRIPESKDLVCPPPPIKRKPTAFKRISTRHSAYNRANLLINPPDLHTYPECIRALFDK